VSSRASLRVVIVDDHAGFRRMMAELLRVVGHVVVGEAHDGSSALHVVRRCVPDVVFVDVGLGEESGFDVASALARSDPAPAILLMSADECPDPARVSASGARAFVAKSRLAAADLGALAV
jgi:DNA-binding NarL/FixJ family response regulator